MTTDESNDLYEQAQDVVLTATILSGLYRDLSPNKAWDEFVEQVGREVYELIVRRVDERSDELERVKEVTCAS